MDLFVIRGERNALAPGRHRAQLCEKISVDATDKSFTSDFSYI